jgi:Nitrile hydratase beta subunit.
MASALSWSRTASRSSPQMGEGGLRHVLHVLPGGFFGVDEFRYGIEQMHPAVYLLSPYYEHWIHTVEHYGKAKGLLDLDEVDRRTQYYLEHPDAPLPQREDPDLVAFVEAVVPAGAPAKRESDKAPQFKVGDTVTVRADSPAGHTRRARYIRGRTGRSCSRTAPSSTRTARGTAGGTRRSTSTR